MSNKSQFQITGSSLFRDLREIKATLYSLYDNLSSRNRRILDKLIDLLLDAQYVFYKAYIYRENTNDKLKLVDELWIRLTIVDSEISFLLDQIKCHPNDSKNIPDKRIEELLRLSPKLIDGSEKWRQSILNKLK